MAGIMNTRKSTKGFYTLEASLFLPLVILAVLTLGYFMRVEGAWEKCVHGAVDESMLAASKSYDSVNALSAAATISKRINDDVPELTSMQLRDLRVMYNDGYADNVTSYRICASIDLQMPLGFSRIFELDQRIKYRGFVGAKNSGNGMGPDLLETSEVQNPVWIFPHSGEKYHGKTCTFVKATAEPTVLTKETKKAYKACNTCDSADIQIGSIVFCFAGEDTAYHKGSCATIVKHTAVIDKTEAIKKGLGACSKCGGN